MRRVDTIKQKVSNYFSINSVHMTDHRRNSRFARPRQIAMYLCRKHSEMSFSSIAYEFQRDHTTIMHAFNRIQELMNKSEEFKADVMNIEAMLPWANNENRVV